MQIDTINQIQCIKIDTFDAEEVSLKEFFVALDERITNTGKLALDLLLNTNIFTHIQNGAVHAKNFDRIVITLGWRFQCMTNFMSHEQVIDVI